MKLISEVSPEKLRGGYYTPAPLVQFCLMRLMNLLPDSSGLEALEPSAGDGAFFRGIAEDSQVAERFSRILAVEPLKTEADEAKRVLDRIPVEGTVTVASAIEWANGTNDQFDAAFGNPPFVRYQFISGAERRAIIELGSRAGLAFPGVSNLWIPVLVAALVSLKPQGAFSFVVPSELLTGSSAAVLRRWLSSRFGELTVDLFRPGSFPEVLQEVVVLSGIRLGREATTSMITISENRLGERGSRVWKHAIDPGESNWTRYLLSTSQLSALRTALDLPQVETLGDIARFQVSAVTGANDFFTVSETEKRAFQLSRWALPLLPRVRNSPGIIHTIDDQRSLTKAGSKAWLLDFSDEKPDPKTFSAPGRYIADGEAAGLDGRYKCRIREPWFRVPHVRKGALMLSKRSHRIPKVIVNQANAFATDTIYRGDVVSTRPITPEMIAACFHSSLTLLTAEIEGRSFGGGVLELVPSEVSRLSVAVLPGAANWIGRLDGLARVSGDDALVAATDEVLAREGSFDPEVLDVITTARHELTERRLERNSRPPIDEPVSEVSEAA